MEFWDEHASDRFEILAFHDASVESLAEMDRELDRRRIREMAWGGRDLPFPVLFDESGTTLRQYGVRAFPTTLLVDPEGRLVGTIDSRVPGTAWRDLDRSGLAPEDLELLERLDASTEAPDPADPMRDGKLPDGDASVSWPAALSTLGLMRRYEGVELGPRDDLVPLGRDLDSGMYEFALAGTGRVPRRRWRTGQLEVDGGIAIVLVLVPGADRPDGTKGEPFLVSKYELTQGQWVRLAGDNPSAAPVGQRLPEGRAVTCRAPVEGVAPARAREVLARVGLDLPTVEEWRWAARARATTTWWTGDDAASLGRAGNLGRLPDDVPASRWAFDDAASALRGRAFPVGLFEANPFGLHDSVGNVWEWCVLDRSGDRLGVRGGGFRSPPEEARTEHAAEVRDPTRGHDDVGLRPVLRLR